MDMGPFANRVKAKLKEYTLPTLIMIPIFALVFYYTIKFADRNFYTAHSGTFKELFSIALAILSGGIFLAVMKWIQFMGFFREEIIAIFGSIEFDEKLQKKLL